MFNILFATSKKNYRQQLRHDLEALIDQQDVNQRNCFKRNNKQYYLNSTLNTQNFIRYHQRPM